MGRRAAEDESARLAEASWSLYGRGESTVVVDGLLAAGPRSRIWRLVADGPGGTRQYAVKWFRPGYRRGGAPVAGEYSALVSLARALDRLRTDGYRIRCPAPVRAWDWGYAMSAVPGRQLDQALARRLLPAGEQAQLARDLVTALTAFHTVHGGPYGDFHPGNVLLGPDRELYLLDPAPADGGLPAWPAPAGPPYLAVDVAHWAFATAVRALRRSIRHPRAVAACFQFARELGRAALERSDDPRLATQLDRCLADQWTRLRRQGPRQYAVAVAAGRLLGPARRD